VSSQNASQPVSADGHGAEAALAALQDQRVEEWIALVRYGSVIPLAVENSLSWRITRPIRLMQTAAKVLRQDGSHRFWATARSRVRRRFGRS
jgi:hypothetical protein